MNLMLHSLLNGKDPESLGDVIELNDGTRIQSIVLGMDAERIQYFTGHSLKSETMSASNICMLYLDNATITIPFPLIPADVSLL